ncbi:MAG: hypothetical protein ACPGC8_02730 [Flavobacteriaceae bacterium]
MRGLFTKEEYERQTGHSSKMADESYTDEEAYAIQLSESIEEKLIENIQKYISKDDLQNEKALDKYIDQILEEKAAKKK